jgi:hypothetical protein
MVKMSYLYRTAVLITRKQPFVDWANECSDDGVEFPDELARTPDVYLGPHGEASHGVDQVLDAVWEDIFEEELDGWCTDQDRWPQNGTREMFDRWFHSQLADSIIDLVPDTPLTEDDADAEDLEEALNTCSWCLADLPLPAGRMVDFELAHCELFEAREGRIIDLLIKGDRIVRGIVTPLDSTPARQKADLIFRACGPACEKKIRRKVPAALQELEAELTEQVGQ